MPDAPIQSAARLVTTRRAQRVCGETLDLIEKDRQQIERLMAERAGLVQVARANGATWQQVADALGVSRQAAQKLYRTVSLSFE